MKLSMKTGRMKAMGMCIIVQYSPTILQNAA